MPICHNFQLTATISKFPNCQLGSTLQLKLLFVRITYIITIGYNYDKYVFKILQEKKTYLK